MITDLFDTKRYKFSKSNDPERISKFEEFMERIEEFDDGAWLLFQINKRSDRYFVTFCFGREEICYVSIDTKIQDVSFFQVLSPEEEDEISESELYQLIEDKSPYFVEWFLFNIVGIKTETEEDKNE